MTQRTSKGSGFNFGVMKALCATPKGRVKLAVLREALLSSRSAKFYSMPAKKFETHCGSIAGAEIDKDDLVALGDLQALRATHLTDRERWLCAEVLASGGYMSLVLLADRLHSSGLPSTMAAMRQLLLLSAYIEFPARGVIKLLGAESCAESFKAAVASSKRNSVDRIKDRLPIDADSVTFDYTVGAGVFTVKRMMIPIAAQPWVKNCGMRHFTCDLAPKVKLGLSIPSGGAARLRRIDEVFMAGGICVGERTSITLTRDGVVRVLCPAFD